MHPAGIVRSRGLLAVGATARGVADAIGDGERPIEMHSARPAARAAHSTDRAPLSIYRCICYAQTDSPTSTPASAGQLRPGAQGMSSPQPTVPTRQALRTLTSLLTGGRHCHAAELGSQNLQDGFRKVRNILGRRSDLCRKFLDHRLDFLVGQRRPSVCAFFQPKTTMPLLPEFQKMREHYLCYNPAPGVLRASPRSVVSSGA